MRRILLPLLLLLASLAGADVSGYGLVFTGKLESDLVVRDSYDVSFFDFDSNGYRVTIYDSSQIYGKRSKITGLVIEGSSKVTFEDSAFLGGATYDAARVNSSPHERREHSYLSGVWGKPFDVEKLVYGASGLLESTSEWHSVRSHRTGKEIWREIHPNDATDIKFLRCSFEGSKRAGLFLHHVTGFLVEDCTGKDNDDYDLGAEWTKSGVFRRNKADKITSHFYNFYGVFDSNEVSTLDVYSQGDPVVGVKIIRNKALNPGVWNSGRILVGRGGFYDWNAAAWLDGVWISENECNWIGVVGGQVLNTVPEVLPRNVFIQNNKVHFNRRNYFDAVRLESVDGYVLEGNDLGGGKVNNYSVGGRVPSRPLVQLTPGGI